MLHIITYPSPISTYLVYSQGFHNDISKTNYRYILTRKESEVLGVFTYYHSTLIKEAIEKTCTNENKNWVPGIYYRGDCMNQTMGNLILTHVLHDVKLYTKSKS